MLSYLFRGTSRDPSYLHNFHSHHHQHSTKMRSAPKPIFNLSYFKGFSSNTPEYPSHDITREPLPAAPATEEKIAADNGKNGFTGNTGYARKRGVYFDHGGELELLNHIFTHPNAASFKDNPKAIIAEIDAFAARKHLMDIGEMKGRLATNLIATHCPSTIIEVGSYIGYSTLLSASTLKSHPLIPTAEKKYITLEQSPLFASITLSLVNLAGLLDLVQVVVGPSSVSLRKLKSEMPRVDLLFFDHYNPLYTNDLEIVEELEMIGVGSLLVANNLVKPGNSRYLKYVCMGVEEKLVVEEKSRTVEEEGGVGVGVGVGELEKGGDPRLVYESGMLKSFEPTDAIEVTMCIGRVEEQANKPHGKRHRRRTIG